MWRHRLLNRVVRREVRKRPDRRPPWDLLRDRPPGDLNRLPLHRKRDRLSYWDLPRRDKRRDRLACWKRTNLLLDRDLLCYWDITNWVWDRLQNRLRVD